MSAFENGAKALQSGGITPRGSAMMRISERFALKFRYLKNTALLLELVMS